MKKNTGFIIILVVFIGILAGAVLLYNNLGDQFAPDTLLTQTAPDTTAADTTAAADATDATVSMAPDFTVTDENGNQVDLYDFLGKPVIVNFWASWCGPCRSEMPDIQKAYEQYGDEIHFLIVNLTDGSRETAEAAADYISQSGYTFPIYFDTTLSAASAYGAYSIPMTYFIGPNGEPIARYSGAMSANILQQGIDMLLGD